MNDYTLAELKLVYRLLHKELVHHPALMDGTFLDDLQTRLQKHAQNEGVDIADHGQWDTWLGNEAVSCEVRVAGRRTYEAN